MLAKVFVRVECVHLEDGTVLPQQIGWQDGREWEITRVVHSCISSANEYEGVRYTVIIGSMEKYLYQLGPRWYVESG